MGTQGISSHLENGNPVKIHLWLKEDDHIGENHSQHSLKFTHLDPIFQTSDLFQAAFYILCPLKILHLCCGSSRSECLHSALAPLKCDPTSALDPYKCDSMSTSMCQNEMPRMFVLDICWSFKGC